MIDEPLYCYCLSDLSSDQNLFEQSGLISSPKLDGHFLYSPLDWNVFLILKMPDFKTKIVIANFEKFDKLSFLLSVWPPLTILIYLFLEYFHGAISVTFFFSIQNSLLCKLFWIWFSYAVTVLKWLTSKNDLIKKYLELQECWSKLPARLNSNSFWPQNWGTLDSRTLKTLVELKIHLLQRFLVICSQSKMNSMGNNKTRTERRPRLVIFSIIKE